MPKGKLKITPIKSSFYQNQGIPPNSEIYSYLVIKVGDEIKKTKVCRAPGTTPSYEETFEYNIDPYDRDLTLALYEYDKQTTQNRYIADEQFDLIAVISALQGNHTFNLKHHHHHGGTVTLAWEFFPMGDPNIYNKQLPHLSRAPRVSQERASRSYSSQPRARRVSGHPGGYSQPEQLKLRVLQAKFPGKLGFFQSFDPFYRIKLVGGQAYQSNVDYRGGLNPTWPDQVATFDLSNQLNDLRIEFLDKGMIRGDKFVAGQKIDINQLRNDGSGKAWFKLDKLLDDGGSMLLEWAFSGDQGGLEYPSPHFRESEVNVGGYPEPAPSPGRVYNAPREARYSVPVEPVGPYGKVRYAEPPSTLVTPSRGRRLAFPGGVRYPSNRIVRTNPSKYVL